MTEDIADSLGVLFFIYKQFTIVSKFKQNIEVILNNNKNYLSWVGVLYSPYLVVVQSVYRQVLVVVLHSQQS